MNCLDMYTETKQKKNKSVKKLIRNYCAFKISLLEVIVKK